MPTWKLVLKVKGGHRYFEDTTSAVDKDLIGRIAVADASGATPELTDDGVLWLDRTRPIRLGGEESAHIPLLRDTGEKAGTGEYNWDAVIVAAHFGMAVEVSDPKLAKMLETLTKERLPIVVNGRRLIVTEHGSATLDVRASALALG